MKKGIRAFRKLTIFLVLISVLMSTLLYENVGKAADDSRVVQLKTVNFPDSMFLIYLRLYVDENENDYLDKEEIAKTKIFNFNGVKITNFKGIEYFENLEELYIGGKTDCGFTYLDISKNVNLRVLEISNNNTIETFDISKNPKLQVVRIRYCDNLKKLDVSKNKELLELNCFYCSISELDVSNNSKLKILYSGCNPIKEIDITHNPNLEELNCSGNQFKELDISNNPKLTELYCVENQLSELNVSNNPELTILYCTGNKLTELDISNNPKLKCLHIQDTDIKILNIGNNPLLNVGNIYDEEDMTLIKNSVKSITLNNTSVTLEKDKTTQLTATVSPADADMTNLIWTSSNTNVATVNSKGLVTAIAPGNATITATAEDRSGVTAKCTITVPSKGTSSGNTDYTGGSSSGITDNKTIPNINAYYRTHIQTFGWEGNAGDITTWKSNGAMSGTSGKSKRLEGINIVVDCADPKVTPSLGIQYTTHCQSYGWLPWSGNGEMNGTEGEAKRLEAIKIQLTGVDAKYYDVYYRVHAQTYGWLGWAKNGAPAGTAGYGKRLEGIQIVVVKKDQTFNQKMENITSARTEAFVAKEGNSPIVNYPATSNTNPVVPGAEDVNVAYRTHVQSFGWQGWKYNGQMSGTSGKAKRLEGINIELRNQKYSGDIVYTTHVQTYGWQGSETDQTKWFKNGAMAGTSGEAKRLEAICINLTGDMAANYDIYYRVHAQSYGWLGWAKNGAPAGTAGYGKRLEGIQVVLVPKNGANPGNYQGITSVRTEAYIKK